MVRQRQLKPLWQALVPAVLLLALFWATPIRAWFDVPANYLRSTICYVNDADVSPVYDNLIGTPEAGTVSGPLTVRIQIVAPEGSPVIRQCYLQYRAADNLWYNVIPRYWQNGMGSPPAGATACSNITFHFDECSFGLDTIGLNKTARGAVGRIRLVVVDANGTQTLNPATDFDSDDSDGVNGQDWQVVSFTMHATNHKPSRGSRGPTSR